MSKDHPHIVSAFDIELKQLAQSLADMNDAAFAMLKDAVALFDNLDQDKALEIMGQDKKIDQIETNIALEAIQLLALRQPMADDLRAIVSSIKIASDIERIADYAANIAERIAKMKHKTAPPKSITELGHATLDILSETTALIQEPSAAKAIHLWNRDDLIDRLYNKTFKEIVTIFAHDMEHVDETTAFMQYAFIAKSLERVGDRATNISEAIYFQRKGDSLMDAIAQKTPKN